MWMLILLHAAGILWHVEGDAAKQEKYESGECCTRYVKLYLLDYLFIPWSKPKAVNQRPGTPSGIVTEA